MFIYIDLIFWSHEVSFFFSFPSDLIIIMLANMFVLHGYKDISGSGIKLKEFLTYVWIDKWEFERSHLSFICREIIIPQLSDLFQSCWIPVVARPTLNECPLYANKVVKNLPASEEEVRDVSLISGSGRSLEEGMAIHTSILAWRIPWTEEPGRLQSMWLQRASGYRALNK